MRKSKVFKALALLNFVGLLTMFLLYRNGSFDNYFYNNNENLLTDPNGGTTLKNTDDSTKIVKDTLNKQRFSSSKSLILIENRPKLDTTPSKPDTTNVKQSNGNKELMYGSKSGRIIEPKKTKNKTKNRNYQK